MFLSLLISLIILSTIQGSISQSCSTYPNTNTTNPSFCASLFASGLSNPRSIEIASNNDMLVVEAGQAQVTILYDSNNDGKISAQEKSKLATATGLNHGLEIDEKAGFLYASSPNTVFRWQYKAGMRTDLGTAEVVVKNLPCCHHTTRTVRVHYDNSNLLYVQSGSGSNVDPDSSHAQIRLFNVSYIPTGGIDWTQGSLFASGLRNEVGVRFDDNGRLFGVENGVDDLYTTNPLTDIHQTNPSEEVNLFSTPGKFYGYPYCWSEGVWSKGKGPGTQWVHPNFENDGVHSNTWCQNTSNVVKPIYNLPAHNAPMDIIFPKSSYSFPEAYLTGAFVSLHGSWDSKTPVGYRVVYLKFTNGIPTGAEDFFFYQAASGAQNWPQGTRPVGLGFAKCSSGDCLYVASDATGEIIEIGYKGNL